MAMDRVAFMYIKIKQFLYRHCEDTGRDYTTKIRKIVGEKLTSTAVDCAQ